MTVWLPCVGASELLRVVSSAPYSQAATGVRRDICRVAGPVRPQPATMTPAALSVSAGCCETDPTGVAIGQLPQGSVMYFSGSLSDSPRRLTELTKEGYLASRTLLETSQCMRTDPLGAGASSPPITLTVNVAATAPSSVTNQATVQSAFTGGGQPGSG